MDAAEMKKLLYNSFQGSPDALRLWAKYQDKGMEVEAVRSRSIEYTDRAESLAEKIALAEAELSELSARDISFEKLSQKRKAIREMRGDLDDMQEWVDRLDRELRLLNHEHVELKRVVDSALQHCIVSACSIVNEEFQMIINQAEALYVAWQDAHQFFWGEYGGTSSFPKLRAHSKSIMNAVTL